MKVPDISTNSVVFGEVGNIDHKIIHFALKVLDLKPKESSHSKIKLLESKFPGTVRTRYSGTVRAIDW